MRNNDSLLISLWNVTYHPAGRPASGDKYILPVNIGSMVSLR